MLLKKDGHILPLLQPPQVVLIELANQFVDVGLLPLALIIILLLPGACIFLCLLPQIRPAYQSTYLYTLTRSLSRFASSILLILLIMNALIYDNTCAHLFA